MTVCALFACENTCQIKIICIEGVNSLNISTYSLKPRFQQLLTPCRDWLIRLGFTPNQVTLFTCCLCVIYAGILFIPNTTAFFLLFLPILLFVRMAFNALDGMVASATNNYSATGSVLNELCDVISDLALFSAFALILPIPLWSWWLLIVLSLLSEFVALAVYQATGVRPFSGPFGKSDRALYLGVLAILLFFYPDIFVLFYIYITGGLILALMTVWNRLKLAK